MISSLFFLIHSFIHEVSSDTRISFAGFSSDFMLSGNYVEILLDFMPMILNSPVISLQEDVAGLYRNVYLLLIRAYTLPHSLENKEIIRSVLAIFLQGTNCINAMARSSMNL